MTKDRCQGFQVFPPSVFYPIHYDYWKHYFEISNLTETMRLIKEAKAIHVWNKLSANEIVYHGSQVPYDIVAKKYCPQIYNVCRPIF